MEIVKKQAKKEWQTVLRAPDANQSINEQINNLYIQKQEVEKNLLKYASEPIRRPSKKHKKLTQELQLINKEIKKLSKTLKKINSIKEITSKLGRQHGKVKLNKTEYFW